MKQLAAWALLLALTLTGCTEKQEQKTLSPEERTDLYETAITAARDEATNDAFPLIDEADDDMAEVLFTLLGVDTQDMTAYAISASPMNTKAYAVAAIYPAAGKEDTVLEALRRFTEVQVQSFKQYLADQYEIAVNARLETLEDGTILLVMCDGQDAVFQSIREKIERGK